MGWDQQAREPLRSRLNWANAELNTAAAVSAAQLPVAAAVWWVGTFDDDGHGVTYSGLFAVGLLCMLVLGPPVLAVLGLLHTVVHTMPAATLARLATRRARGPEWAWHLAFVGVLGAVWGLVVAALGGWSPSATAALFALLGALPAFAVRYVRRWRQIMGRDPGGCGLWFWSGLASFGLGTLVVGGGLIGLAVGLIEEYEPPKLSEVRLDGVWRGDHGAVLRLYGDGRAELKAVPYVADTDDWSADVTPCGGTGSWSLGKDHDSKRDTVVVSVGRCGDGVPWTLSGTAADPELFALFGDPDGGDVRVLERD